MADRPTITGFLWVPDFARGLVRELRPRWAFEELGVAYDVRLIDFAEVKSAAHRVFQPFGQVPTYRDDQVEIFESGAILLHIARRWPGLLPADPQGEAHAIEWLFGALNSVEMFIFHLMFIDVFDKDAGWSEQSRECAVNRVRQRLADLAGGLGAKPYIAGDSFTVADIAMAHVLDSLRYTDLVAEQPALSAYLERCKARPAYRKALADHLASFTEAPAAA